MNILHNKCIIIGHLSLNELFIINGIVNYYSTIYDKVYLLCKQKDFETINQLFLDNNLIIPFGINFNQNILPNNHHIFSEYSNLDIIRIGYNNSNWNLLKSSHIIGNTSYLYFKTFYTQLNLDYHIRYQYEKINRNYYSEELFYLEVMKNYNNRYKFIHGIIDNDIIENNTENILIFNPFINFYNKYSKFNNLWTGKVSNNMLDYCTILEKADEIHLSYDFFLSLCMLLNLSKVKKKYVYTNITYIKDYHINMKDWIIIYTV